MMTLDEATEYLEVLKDNERFLQEDPERWADDLLLTRKLIAETEREIAGLQAWKHVHLPRTAP